MIDKKALYAPDKYSPDDDRRAITRAIRFWLDMQFGDDYAEATRALYDLGNILRVHDEYIHQKKIDMTRAYRRKHRDELAVSERERRARRKLTESMRRQNVRWVFLSDVRDKKKPDQQDHHNQWPKRRAKSRCYRIIDDIEAGKQDCEIAEKYHTTPEVISVYRIYKDALLANESNDQMNVEAFHRVVIRGRIVHGGLGIDIYSRDN